MPSRGKKTLPSRKRKPAPRKSRQPAQLSAGQWFEKLVAVQERLRAPGGCPWDREQTHATLRSYLIEEAYEVLDALDSGDDSKFAEEMGDLLLQVLFHSDIAREQGRFTVSDVIREIHDKMIRRHPHVFGDVHVKNSHQVLQNWERIKAQERLEKAAAPKNAPPKNAASRNGAETPASPASLLDGVSRGLPAMLEGLQLTRKAARAGFDWQDAGGIFEKLREEMAEVRHALTENSALRAEEELGDLLFAAVNLARFVHVDPEIALKKANAKFHRRFVEMERSAANRERTFAGLPREEMESLWDAAKRGEKKPESPASANGKSENQKSQNSKLAAAHTPSSGR
jgi:tetrapyrrole methylase family protein / MazG family protein